MEQFTLVVNHELSKKSLQNVNLYVFRSDRLIAYSTLKMYIFDFFMQCYELKVSTFSIDGGVSNFGYLILCVSFSVNQHREPILKKIPFFYFLSYIIKSNHSSDIPVNRQKLQNRGRASSQGTNN